MHYIKQMQLFSELWRLDIKNVVVLSASLLLSAYSSASSSAEKVKIGAGIGLLFGGPDFIVSYQPNDSHWVFNLRHGYNKVEDEGYGPVTTEEYTWIGPVVDYLFTPEDTGSFYAGAGIYQITLDFNSQYFVSGIPTSEDDSDSMTAPVLGGGYTRWLGENMYFDVGIFFSVSGELYVETSSASVETNALMGRLIIGAGF